MTWCDVTWWLKCGEMSISQRRGVISLLPKENKDTLLLKNWRPISLLNTDYKIATKCIAKRLEKILPKLINRDQTGYVNYRLIGENIRLISDVIELYKKKNICDTELKLSLYADDITAFVSDVDSAIVSSPLY